jgi:hypothetical protein
MFPNSIAPPAGPSPGIQNRLAPQAISVTDCINALSDHLGSPLVIDGLPGIDGMKYDDDPSPLTHLMFHDDLASRQRSVLIHLVRNDEHLLLKDMALPREQNPLNTLFRAVATSVRAALTWDQNTLPANDADTQALRELILSTTSTAVQTTTHREPHAGSSAGTAHNAQEALFEDLKSMLIAQNAHEKSLRHAGTSAGIAPGPSPITQRRPHVPLSIMPTAADKAPVARPRQGMKRRHPDEATEAAPSVAAAAPLASVIVRHLALSSPPSPATATGHPDRPDGPPTPP